MKRMILSVLAIFLLTAGAAMAQSANTTAPGPTQQREPGQTSNNLPNPGNPQTDLSNNDTYTEGGTVEGTANESMQGTAGSQTTGNVGTTGTTGTTTGTATGTATGTTTGTATGTATGVTSETEDAEGMDVDVDTGSNAAGLVDVDVSTTADADTDASGIDETGTESTTDTTETGALPETASELPLLAIAGLLALASAFMVRFARRNA